MAINHSAMTQAIAETKIGQLKSEQNNLLAEVQSRTDLDSEWRILVQKEKIFFKSLGLDKFPDPLLELRQRIYDIHKTNFQAFSGPNLYKKILQNYQQAVNINNDDEDKKFQSYLRHYIEQNLPKNAISSVNFEDYVKGLISNEIQYNLQNIKGQNIAIQVSRLKSSSGFGKDFDQFFISKMTPTARKYAQQFMKEYEQKLEKEGIDPKNIVVKNSDSVIQFSGYAKQVETPDAEKRLLTPNEAAIFFKNNKQALQRIWVNVINFILSLVPQIAHQTVKQSLYDFYKNNPYGIFVGGNVNGLAGLVGELETRCVLAILLEGQNLSTANLTRIATQLVHGKQSSSDFMLKTVLGGLGIQTKNTTQDVFSGRIRSINFTSLTLPSFLELLQMSGHQKEVINSIYATYIFNIEYQRNQIYQAESNSEFRGTRQEIIDLKEGMDRVFSYFVSELVHLAVREGANNQPGNIAFHIGGKGIVMASEIIAAVITYLETSTKEGGPFKVTPILKQGSEMTIVDYLNKNLKSGRKRDTGFDYGNQPIQEYVLNDVTLKSSFNFTQLLNMAKNSIIP